jgi:hypothetical protein
LEKAKIQVLGKNSSITETFEVMFNPANYTIHSGNTFHRNTVPGTSMPVTQFVSGDPTALTVELFFDTFIMSETEISNSISSPTRTELKDVRNFTDQVTKLMDIDSELHAPPICTFAWGTFQFKGVVEKTDQTITMFLSNGVPVRAKLTVTFKEIGDFADQAKKTPLHSSDRTKQRLLVEGDQLWMVASREYGDPELWREIAKANNFNNPRKLETGGHIVIPPLE